MRFDKDLNLVYAFRDKERIEKVELFLGGLPLRVESWFSGGKQNMILSGLLSRSGDSLFFLTPEEREVVYGGIGRLGKGGYRGRYVPGTDKNKTSCDALVVKYIKNSPMSVHFRLRP